jgi:hypothetical protein
MHCLGTQNQYRDVPYVESHDGYYVCQLCQTGPIYKKHAGSHFNGSRHAAAYRNIQSLEAEDAEMQDRASRVTSMMALASQKVKQLGLESWQSDVKAEMFDYVAKSPRKEVFELLEKYTKMEKLSLLELALWKSRILCNDITTFSTVQEMREYVVLESDFDVEAFAHEMRMTSGSKIVIPLVSAFLGW